MTYPFVKSISCLHPKLVTNLVCYNNYIVNVQTCYLEGWFVHIGIDGIRPYIVNISSFATSMLLNVANGTHVNKCLITTFLLDYNKYDINDWNVWVFWYYVSICLTWNKSTIHASCMLFEASWIILMNS